MNDVARMEAGERAELFREAAGRRSGMTPEMVEKDFWVCWTLLRLFALKEGPASLIFKGGTSLSKVYGVIERFSEDIDLSLNRNDLGFTGERDPANAPSGKKAKKLLEELVAACRDAIRDRLLPAIQADFATILGSVGEETPTWSVMIDAEDPQSLNFVYPPGVRRSGARLPAYLRPFVLLELGARSDAWPAEDHTIEPYAAQLLPGAFGEKECRVHVLAAERTFWEKATLLHAEYHRPLDKGAAEQLSRHYYDLVQLHGSSAGKRALGQMDLLEAVVKHKRLFFSSGWANYETAKPGTFRLVPPPARQTALKADYQQMREEMIFGAAPEWDDVLERLRALETEINSQAFDP